MTFTPPASGSTRLSSDVWTLICSHAANNGNSSPREALEQLVRQALGDAQTIVLNCAELSQEPTQPPLAAAPSTNAAAALDALLLD